MNHNNPKGFLGECCRAPWALHAGFGAEAIPEAAQRSGGPPFTLLPQRLLQLVIALACLVRSLNVTCF